MRWMLNLWFALWAPALLAAGPVAAESGIPLDVGGGLIAGGYLEDLRRDWRAGPGGTLFIQLPLPHDLEARLSGSMLWSVGSGRSRTAGGGPDLGGRPGDLPDAIRRTSVEGALLWRLEPLAIGQVGVPYVGAGLSAYELAATYSAPGGGERGSARWDPGAHLVAGLRFYRTSGLFVAVETKLHGIDTPGAWSYAYEGGVLIGWMIGP